MDAAIRARDGGSFTDAGNATSAASPSHQVVP
jgi:hypothetical protein